MRVHLCTIFGGFFLFFFILLGFYAKFFYQEELVKNMATEWPALLEDRLQYTSQSVSTAFYMSDKAFINAMFRLRNLYEEASKDSFPIKTNAYPRVGGE